MYAWVSLINAVLALGMETTFFRYLNKAETETDKSKVYCTSFFSIGFFAILVLGAISLGINSLAPILHDQTVASIDDYETFIQVFAWVMFFDAVAVIPFAKVRADGRPLRYGLIKLFNILIFVGLNLFFLFGVPWVIKNGYPLAAFFQSWYRSGWIGYVFISNLVSSAVTVLLLLPELLKLSAKFDTALLKQMMAYSFPVLVANLSFIVNETSDKIFLKELLPAGQGMLDVGIYGSVSKIAIFLSIFVQAFRLGAEPFFFSHAKNKNAAETYSGIMNYFIIAVCLIFVALSANIEILKYFIKGKDAEQIAIYWSGLKVVPVLLFGYVSLGIYMNLSIWYKLSDQTRYGLYISGIGAIITIILNVIFIPRFSYVASAWISLVAYASMMILSYILGQKHYPIPYNLKKALLYIVISIVIVLLSFLVFHRSLVVGNILFLLFAAGVIFTERKELKSIFIKK